VSHDRHFLDAVVTSTLVFEEGGAVRKYVGGYSDWARQHHALTVAEEAPGAARADAAREGRRKPTSAPQKLSYKLQRELDALPAEIERLEAQVAGLQTEVADPKFYSRTREDVDTRLQQLQSAQEQLESAVERWAELEEHSAAIAATPRAD